MTAHPTPPDPAAPAAARPEELARSVEAYVRRELGRILGIAPELVDITGEPMNSLGVGSVAGLELQRRIEAALPVRVDLARLLRAESATELIDHLLEQLGAAPAGTVSP